MHSPIQVHEKEEKTKQTDIELMLPSMVRATTDMETTANYDGDMFQHTDAAWCMGVSSTGVLASDSRDGTVRVWDMRTGRCTHIFVGFSGQVLEVKFISEKQLLGACCADGTLRLFYEPVFHDCATPLVSDETMFIFRHTKAINQFHFHEGVVYTAGNDQKIRA